MKELSIEQKAKAYDDALEKLQEALAPTEDGCKISGLTRGCIESIFPELKESEDEDEKIRKGIIRCVKCNMPDNEFRKKYIAWLEKMAKSPQLGEQKPQRMVSAEAKEALYDKPTERSEEHLKDGVYYICDDEKKTIVPFKATLTPPEDAMGVLLVQGERSIIIALRDCNDGEKTTLTKQKYPSNLKGNYIDTCNDAVADWNGQKNTERLKAVGLSDNISLSDGWYIPSMGEMLFIFTHRKEVNAALEKAGGQPIADDWYWTSTEYSANYAWDLYLGDSTGSIAKSTNSLRVRPVSVFKRTK